MREQSAVGKLFLLKLSSLNYYSVPALTFSVPLTFPKEVDPVNACLWTLSQIVGCALQDVIIDVEFQSL